MHQADAQEAALLFHPEPLAEVQRVVVAVPGENAAVTQKLRDLSGIVLPNSNRYSRAALVKALRITDTEEPQLRNREQALDQPPEQRRFVLACSAIGGQQRAPSILPARVLTPPKLRKIIDGRADSGNQLLDLRPGLPAVRKRIRRRAHFVRLELQEALRCAIARA